MRYNHLILAVTIVSLSLGFISSSANAQETPSPSLTYGQGRDVYTTTSGMAINGQMLFMTWPATPDAPQRFLAAIDISSPDKPRLISQLPISGFPQGVAVMNQHVLVVNGQELLAIDASDASHMKIVSRTMISLDPMYGPQDLLVNGSNVFLACRRAGLQAISLHDITQPEIFATLPLPGFTRSVTLSSDKQLLVASDTLGMHVVDLKLAGSKSVNTEMKLVARIPIEQGSIGKIITDGRYAYAAGGNLLLGTVELKKNALPVWVAMSFNRGDMTPYYGRYSHDAALYKFPRTAGELSATGSTYQWDLVLVADGEVELSVVTTEPGVANAYLQPLARNKAGLSSKAVMATAVRINQSHAYVTDQNFGLRVYSLSNPSQPELTGTGVDLRP